MPRLEFIDANRRRGFCHVELVGLGDCRTAIVATELAANPGMSITNAAEEAAMAACRQFDIDPSRLIWIEHYNADSYHDRGREESFDLVTFGKIMPTGSVIFTGPVWKRMDAKDWTRLGMRPRSPLTHSH